MASMRKPRGYTVNRPPFVEICEGVRPNVQALALEAWTGLPPVRVDDHHHDPIVLDAGTIVGVCTGSHGGTSPEGKILPAAWASGAPSAWTLRFDSTDSTWGLRASNSTDFSVGDVRPMGVVFQPIYSFMLQQHFTNYKRTESVGIVTDYVIQIPAITTAEHAIRAGDVVMVNEGAFDYGRHGSVTLANLAGRFARKAGLTIPDTADHGTISSLRDEMVVGRCLKSFEFATGTASTKFQDDDAATVAAAAKAEFVGLDRVQTVPGMKLSGSGTGGVPGHLLGGYSTSGGSYRALTILVRL